MSDTNRVGPVAVWSAEYFNAVVAAACGWDPSGWGDGTDVNLAGFDLAAQYLVAATVAGAHRRVEPTALAAMATLGDAHALVCAGQTAAGFDDPPPPVRSRLDGVTVALRATHPSDWDWLTALVTHPDNLAGPPLWGMVPAAGQLPEVLAARAVAALVITERASGRPVGLVRATDHDPFGRHAHLETVLDPDLADARWPLEGVAVALDYLFGTVALHKVYLELTPRALAASRTAIGSLLDVEGVLRAHRRHGDRHLDVTLCAITAERWRTQRHRWLPAIREASPISR